MPSLELRGRYVLREYWGDAELFRKLTAAEREIYMGLWMLADDKGFLPRDVHEIAAALFRFEVPSDRERRVRLTLDKLRRLAKIVTYRCGCLEIPAVRRYPRPGQKNHTHEEAHRAHGVKDVQTSSNETESGLTPSPDPTLPITNPNQPRERMREEENGRGPERIGATTELSRWEQRVEATKRKGGDAGNS